MSKKRGKIFWLLPIVLVLSLIACGQTVSENNESQEQVVLTVWRCNMTAERTALIEELNQIYMDENPHIKIEFTSLPDSFNQKLELAFENDSAPDVFSPNGSIASYITNEYIAPLDEYYDTWDYKDNILPAAIDAIRSLDTEENKLYILPDGNNVSCLWIRSDWFADASLKTPVTWEDVFTDIELLTDKEAGRYGIGLRGGSGAPTNVENLMYSYSGITEYIDENGKCTINDPKNVEFIERWLGLYGIYSAEGDIGNGWTELAASFQSGKSAIIQHNLGSASGHMEAFGGDLTKFEAIPFPQSETGNTVYPALGPSGASVSACSKNKQEAFDYCAYITTAEACSRINELWGQVPMDKSVLETADWIQDTPWMKMGAELLLSDTTTFYANPSYLASYSSILDNEVGPSIQAVMAGEMTAQEMCDNWAKCIEEAYEEEMR